jgi:hypothetical protein
MAGNAKDKSTRWRLHTVRILQNEDTICGNSRIGVLVGLSAFLGSRSLASAADSNNS